MLKDFVVDNGNSVDDGNGVDDGSGDGVFLAFLCFDDELRHYCLLISMMMMSLHRTWPDLAVDDGGQC